MFVEGVHLSCHPERQRRIWAEHGNQRLVLFMGQMLRLAQHDKSGWLRHEIQSHTRMVADRRRTCNLSEFVYHTGLNALTVLSLL